MKFEFLFATCISVSEEDNESFLLNFIFVIKWLDKKCLLCLVDKFSLFQHPPQLNLFPKVVIIHLFANVSDTTTSEPATTISVAAMAQLPM